MAKARTKKAKKRHPSAWSMAKAWSTKNAVGSMYDGEQCTTSVRTLLTRYGYYEGILAERRRLTVPIKPTRTKARR